MAVAKTGELYVWGESEWLCTTPDNDVSTGVPRTLSWLHGQEVGVSLNIISSILYILISDLYLMYDLLYARFPWWLLFSGCKCGMQY